MCRDINTMDAAVKDRFKAIHVLYSQVNDYNTEEQKEQRDLEVKYEKLYAEVYAKRAALLKGETNANEEELVKKFDERALIFADGFADVEVGHCDVKDIQNSTAGVSGFWLKAMCGVNSVSPAIFEKDRPILGYLQDITLDLHEGDFGYDLTFHFEKNSYFTETQLKKQFYMKTAHSVDHCIGTVISWTAGSDVTKTKKKKGKGKKKSTVTVKCDSFFNFFETIEATPSKALSKMGKDDSEEEDEENEALEDDFQLGNSI
jgi:nucleosome assembly protein 1-like 1